MTNLTTIELFKEDMKFSAGHYTIFSPTHREKLHGHNFTVYAAITAETNEFGMAFDYDIYKETLRKLCKSLSEFFLVAGASAHQTIEEDGDYLYVHFNNEKIPFLQRDVLVLPVKNITVEELSLWFINELTKEQAELDKHGIHEILIKVFSGPGQSGSAQWKR
ncbi:MAG: 6-pyruvoyl tetrahydrobiopterin synthase [Legionellales bacterium]|nr:6-pyruvoyl tetrahydrobiopterin synthase [Legionellales bacterium]|tara:strand:- start:10883 stop:11371 length:489 start_codon:yes stop_codon:yes gene_type:complete